MSDCVWPQRWQHTRLPGPWASPGKNTGVGCHFLLQCKKVKSLSCVRLLVTPWTAAHQAPLSMGFSKQVYWRGVSLPSPCYRLTVPKTIKMTLIRPPHDKFQAGSQNWLWYSVCSRFPVHPYNFFLRAVISPDRQREVGLWTQVCLFPRLLASWQKTILLSYKHFPLSYWVLSSKQPYLSSVTESLAESDVLTAVCLSFSQQHRQCD